MPDAAPSGAPEREASADTAGAAPDPAGSGAPERDASADTAGPAPDPGLRQGELDLVLPAEEQGHEPESGDDPPREPEWLESEMHEPPASPDSAAVEKQAESPAVGPVDWY